MLLTIILLSILIIILSIIFVKILLKYKHNIIKLDESLNNNIKFSDKRYIDLLNNYSYNKKMKRLCPICESEIDFEYNINIINQDTISNNLYSKCLDNTKEKKDHEYNMKCNKCKSVITFKIVQEAISVKPWSLIDNNVNEYYMSYENKRYLLGVIKNDIFFPYDKHLNIFWQLYKERRLNLIKIFDLENVYYEVSEFLHIIKQ